MSSGTVRRALEDLVQLRSGADAVSWLKEAIDVDELQFGECLAQLPKKFGHKHLIAGFKDRQDSVLMTQHGAMPIGHWRTDRAARALLIAMRAARAEKPFKFLFATYDNGDTETRVAALYAVNLVDDDDVEQGMALIHDAGRTYLEELMNAAWCNHPFATVHMSNVEYRKAVLKSLFCNVPIEGFLGLSERADNELAHSLKDFADEREAAGRPVPDVLWPVLALHPQPGLIARLIGRLEHPLAIQRIVSARSLRNAKDSRAVSFLQERLTREDDPKVTAAIHEAIEACSAS